MNTIKTTHEKIQVIQTLQRYFDAWNAHDAQALYENMDEGSTYKDSTTSQELNREETVEHMSRVLQNMPNLKLNVKTVALSGHCEIEAQWVLNNADISIPVKGKIVVNGAKIEKVECRFEGDEFQKQFFGK